MFDAIDKVESLTGLYLQVKTEREVLIFFLTISGQAKSFRAHASGIIWKSNGTCTFVQIRIKGMFLVWLMIAMCQY